MNQHAFIALDNPDEWGKFSKPVTQTEPTWESHIVVEGMHCAACAINVERALIAVAGVSGARVNATSKRAAVTWSADATMPSQWMSALTQAGYPALPANEIFNLDERKQAQRLMLWRLLVAGFCMMQVMMYAYPAYIAKSGDITTDVLNLLRWASWVLTLPVILFSARPFLANAYNDIKQRQISMDLPVAIGIIITFIVSSAATFQPNGWWGAEVYFDSLTMFVFFLLTGRWLELRMRDRTAGALDVLMRRLPESIEWLNGKGEFVRVAVSRLKVGDVVQVLPGEAFPADGVIMAGDTSADEALLTGESNPVHKAVGQAVIAGSHNLVSPVQVRVDKLGAATRYAQIVTLMERASLEKPRLAMLADRIARPFLIGVLLAAAGSAALLWSVDHGRALMAAVAVLIVTCPCALSLATPAAMLTISGALARQGVLVRRMQALETLTQIDTIVFDKTGTLTNDSLAIGQISTAPAYSQAQALALAAALAAHSLHPISKALVAAQAASPSADNTAGLTLNNIQEIAGAGLRADTILGTLRLGSAAFCGLTQQGQAYAEGVHLVSDLGWIATFAIEESVKDDVIFSLQALNNMGINVKIWSGDNIVAVKRFAEKVGVADVQGACSPQDKLTLMHRLQQDNRQVVMVGDGLNDGPILALANVSIAMGQGVPLAQAQSDFVILNNQIVMVLVLVQQAKKTMKIVKQNLVWAVVYNAICIPLAIAGLLPAWLAGLGMALSSLLVVSNALRLSRLPLMQVKAG